MQTNFFYIYKFFDKLTYYAPLTRMQTIGWHLMNVGFKMIFLQRIFSYNFKDEIFIHSFLSLV